MIHKSIVSIPALVSVLDQYYHDETSTHSVNYPFNKLNNIQVADSHMISNPSVQFVITQMQPRKKSHALLSKCLKQSKKRHGADVGCKINK